MNTSETGHPEIPENTGEVISATGTGEISTKPAQAAPKPNHCVHCDARLSAIEVKMGRCLSCGRDLAAESAQAGGSPAAGARSFEIRI